MKVKAIGEVKLKKSMLGLFRKTSIRGNKGFSRNVKINFCSKVIAF